MISAHCYKHVPIQNTRLNRAVDATRVKSAARFTRVFKLRLTSKDNNFNWLAAGHGRVLQVEVSDEEPTQVGPPLAGAGLLQSRVRDWDPLPQVRLQVPQEVQVPQLPAAWILTGLILKWQLF